MSLTISPGALATSCTVREVRSTRSVTSSTRVTICVDPQELGVHRVDGDVGLVEQRHESRVEVVGELP